MTPTAQQVAADELAPGMWSVRLRLGAAPEPHHPRPHPHDPRLRAVAADGTQAQVQALFPAARTPHDEFTVVLGVDPGARVGRRVDVHGSGWSAEVLLTAPDLPAPVAPSPPLQPPAIDYRARDFDALRAQLLGVIDERFGATLADHPVSQTAALVEQLAYLGDNLSYQQDAVATEAYLATARRRISVTRHAALLDYPVFQGRSARVWLRFEVTEAITLPAGTKVVAHGQGEAARIAPATFREGLAPGALVFETVTSVDLRPDDGQPLRLSPDAHHERRLAPQAVTARLEGSDPGLAPRALVLLEPEGALGGHVVRLTDVRLDGADTVICWDADDALPDEWALTQLPLRAWVGNLVIADHGESSGELELPLPEAGRRYWPLLPQRWPSICAGAGDEADGSASAAALLQPPAAHCRDAVTLTQRDARELRWRQRSSLLESGPTDADFVVEREDDGSARVRFGDGTCGLRPAAGARLVVQMRSGLGAVGNVPAGAIRQVVTDDVRVSAVRNPCPAVGGADPEPIDLVRIEAPRAFRFTDRAVTAPQYAAAAQAVPGVADAVAEIARSGTGPVARVHIRAREQRATADVLRRVAGALEQRRPASVRVEVEPARTSPATIEAELDVRPGWASSVAREVDTAIATTLLTPAAFGFGTALHPSQLIALLAAIDGVQDVRLTRFCWFADDVALREALEPPFGSIIGLRNDPAAPEHGTVSVRLRS